METLRDKCEVSWRERMLKVSVQLLRPLMESGSIIDCTEERVEMLKLPRVLLPEAVLPPKRIRRKEIQVACMVKALREIMPTISMSSGLHIVDFCGGAGHVGVVLAAMYPQHYVSVIDTNPVACNIGRDRRRRAGLTNVSFVESSIVNNWLKSTSSSSSALAFDVAIGLHACGWLTDYILKLALVNGAHFAVCSCCTGKISKHTHFTNQEGMQLSYPQSTTVAACMNNTTFYELAKFADATSKTECYVEDTLSICETLESTGKTVCERLAKLLIEYDRSELARQHGYVVMRMRLPYAASPKNDIVCAAPLWSQTAQPGNVS